MYSNPISQEILETTDVNLKNVDLTNCDREPIHIPNLIQPHGVLLAVSATEYVILQASLNTAEMLGRKAQDLLNKPLKELLGEEQVEMIQNCLAKDFDNINPLVIKINHNELNKYFNGIIHRNEKTIIIELEPTQSNQEINFFDFYKLVKSPINKIQNTTTLNELCNVIVQQVQQITEFDRVMVYQFNSDGAGKVIAEAKTGEIEPFLGLHYPATDVPKQAKYLYILNLLRLIPDANYQAVAITPELNPLTNKPLDLSLSVLRSVSPLHTEYLSNMGVAASMSISIIKNQQLWGLIACHHHTPKHIPYEIRTVCELIAQVVSFELAAKEENHDLDYKMKLKSIQSQFVQIMSQVEELEQELTQYPDHLLNLVGADGVAFSFGNEITLIGKTPNQSAITAMLPWLETQFNQDVIYHTTCLTNAYPDAEEYKDVASGLLALLISRVQKTFIIWFRPEVIQTVNWGGNPTKPVQIDQYNNLRMSPRKSFAKWQETVRLKSLPWKLCELEAALELRSSIVSIVLKKSDQLIQINKELSRSNTELDSFAYIASHDLKEPLRGIYNYSSFLIEDYGASLNEDGINKLQTLMRLTHRMEDLINSLLHYSRLGRVELEMRRVDLNDLIRGLIEMFKISQKDKQVNFIIPRSLPTINCDRTQISELFTNLISNGIKYNEKSEIMIEIGYLDSDDRIAIAKMSEYAAQTEIPTIFYVRDNGIGIRDKHSDSVFRIFKRLHGQNKYGGGTGAGLTIAKKIVERHGGEIWLQSIYGKGSTFYFTLQ